MNMKSNNSIPFLILEKYQTGDLCPDKAKQVKEILESNKEFKKELNVIKRSDEYVKNKYSFENFLSEILYKKRMKNVQKEMTPSNAKKGSFILNGAFVSLTLLVLFFVGVINFKPTPFPTNNISLLTKVIQSHGSVANHIISDGITMVKAIGLGGEVNEFNTVVSGDDGYCAVQVGNDLILQLGANTAVRMDKASFNPNNQMKMVKIKLLRGSIAYEVKGKQHSKDSYILNTPSSIIQVSRGKYFVTVDTLNNSTLDVIEGKAVVAGHIDTYSEGKFRQLKMDKILKMNSTTLKTGESLEFLNQMTEEIIIINKAFVQEKGLSNDKYQLQILKSKLEEIPRYKKSIITSSYTPPFQSRDFKPMNFAELFLLGFENDFSGSTYFDSRNRRHVEAAYSF